MTALHHHPSTRMATISGHGRDIPKHQYHSVKTIYSVQVRSIMHMNQIKGQLAKNHYRSVQDWASDLHPGSPFLSSGEIVGTQGVRTDLSPLADDGQGQDEYDGGTATLNEQNVLRLLCTVRWTVREGRDPVLP
jgi:hypothetical protein